MRAKALVPSIPYGLDGMRREGLQIQTAQNTSKMPSSIHRIIEFFKLEGTHRRLSNPKCMEELDCFLFSKAPSGMKTAS